MLFTKEHMLSHNQPTRKKRVGIVSYTLPPAISGVEMVIRDHSRLLSNNGFRVFLLGALGKKFRSEIDVQIAKTFDPKNANVRAIQKELTQGHVTNKFQLTKKKYKKIILKWITTNKIEVLFVHNVLSRHYNLALTAALSEVAVELSGTTKFITWVHDASFVDLFYTKLKTNLKDKYPWNLISEYQPQFTYVTISNTRKKELVKLYKVDGRMIQVIPNGIDLNKMLPLPLQTRTLFKDILERKPDYIGIIPVRIAERKNIEYAIQLAKTARDLHGKRILFIVTGALHLQNIEAVRYYEFLQNEIAKNELAENFLFLYNHQLSTEEKFNIYKLNIRDLYLISDFLFLPSKGEGFGLPIIEAGFVRLPIFASNLEVFREVGNGYINLFNLEDPIEDTLITILDYLKKSRTTIFHKLILTQYSLEKIVRDHLIPLIKSP